MKKVFLILAGIFLGSIPLCAQSIHGVVHNKKMQPVTGASVLVTGTFKATSTDSAGRFAIIDVPVKDTLVLKVSAISFNDAVIKITALQAQQDIEITLSEKTAELKEVIISAGSFEASDEKKTTILKPFDIAT